MELAETSEPFPTPVDGEWSSKAWETFSTVIARESYCAALEEETSLLACVSPVARIPVPLH